MKLFIGAIRGNLIVPKETVIEPQYVYVTRYALTIGVLRCEVIAEQEDYYIVKDSSFPSRQTSFVKGWCYTSEEEAQAKAQKLIQWKIASLERQRLKLEAKLNQACQVVEIN